MKVDNNNKEQNAFVKFLNTYFIPRSQDTKKQLYAKICMIIAAIALVIAIILGIGVIAKYAKGRADAKDYDKDYPTSSQQSSNSTCSDNATDVDVQPEPEPLDPETGVVADFVTLFKRNNEVVGHLGIPDTKLSLPIVQGKDNVYYLDHTLDKEYEPYGVPFLDYRALFTQGIQSQVLTIYGHSMKDGSYFAPVKEYKNVEFYKKHPKLEFNTIYGKGEYKIVGLFMEDVNWDKNPEMFNYHDYVDEKDGGLMSEQRFNEYVSKVKERSYFTTDVDVQYGDTLVALSTCDTEVNKLDFRVCLVARKIRPGEDKEVNITTAKENVNQLMPKRWVEKMGKKNPFVK